VYRAEAPKLAGIARALGVPTAECEDVVQEAFVRLHRRWDSLSEREDLGGYLRVTVVNLVRDRARRSGRDRTSTEEPAPGADHDAEVGALSRRVEAALDGLSARQRECVVLRYYGGLSDREIATATGLGLGSVKTHVRRGLAALRPVLGEEEVTR